MCIWIYDCEKLSTLSNYIIFSNRDFKAQIILLHSKRLFKLHSQVVTIG